MDILGALFKTGTLQAGAPGPTDDFWYRDIGGGGMSKSGEWVDAATAQKISAWYRGRMILATVLAMLPFPVYQRLPNDGGSEPVPDHPLYDVLHDTPNSWQDSFQWRREKVFNVIDHGWSYDWIVAGSRGFVHELQPIAPKLVTPEQIKSGPNRGRYLFHVRDEQSGRSTVHTQDDIFYLRGAEGKGILEFARTSIGTTLATGSYAANIFGTGSLNGGTISNPGILNDEAARRMARSFITKPGEHHIPKVLEQGSTFTPNTMTPEDAQMLLSQKFGIDEMARWLGVPRQMLENSDPSFGNAEQFDESFLTYSMGGWLSLFEFAVNSQLVLASKKYYAEFTRDAIARGKLIDRWNVHVAAVNAGIKTVDEARRKEGLNARGGEADKLRQPQNITGKPTTAIPSSQPAKGDQAGSKAEAIVVESAARLIRKEVKAVQALAVKHAADQDAFAGAVTDFYTAHVELVSQTLQMPPAEAERYCSQQSAQVVMGDWMAALTNWQSEHYAQGLAALALEEAAA